MRKCSSAHIQLKQDYSGLRSISEIRTKVSYVLQCGLVHRNRKLGKVIGSDEWIDSKRETKKEKSELTPNSENMSLNNLVISLCLTTVISGMKELNFI